MGVVGGCCGAKLGVKALLMKHLSSLASDLSRQLVVGG